MLYVIFFLSFFFFKQKTAYEMRISDWSSDVCSSDLNASAQTLANLHAAFQHASLWMGEADQCLARSIAFRMLAFRLGFAPTLVLGVKLDPFAAHCWVQSEDCVANDSLSRVRCFKIGRASCRARVCQYV